MQAAFKPALQQPHFWEVTPAGLIRLNNMLGGGFTLDNPEYAVQVGRFTSRLPHIPWAHAALARRYRPRIPARAAIDLRNILLHFSAARRLIEPPTNMKNFSLALDLVRSFQLGADFNVDEVGPHSPFLPQSWTEIWIHSTHHLLRPDFLRL
jgi:hypothetical protein